MGVGYTCIEKPSFTCNVETGCLMCSSENTCSECSSGYKLVSGNCTELECSITNCAECFNSTKCNKCLTNYYLMSNECKLKTYGCNYDHCIACAMNPEVCTQCEEGYYSK